jgi:hypothetical protein
MTAIGWHQAPAVTRFRLVSRLANFFTANPEISLLMSAHFSEISLRPPARSDYVAVSPDEVGPSGRIFRANLSIPAKRNLIHFAGLNAL